MICKRCGFNLSDDACFCPECGTLTQVAETETTEFESTETEQTANIELTEEHIEFANETAEQQCCPACGKQLSSTAIFCEACGRRLGESDTALKPAAKSNSKFAIILGIVFGVVIFLTCILVIIFTNLSTLKQKDSNNASQQNAPISTIQPIATPTPPVISRVNAYNPSLTYKRMSGIHNTVATSDEVYLEIQSVIKDFDQMCEDYMNYGSDGILKYLRPGTTAYQQQIGYGNKNPGMYQDYIDITVLDTRVGGGYYYAWVSETMDVTEKGQTKREYNRWVYKLENNGAGDWTVSDYTKDPAA